MKIKEAAKRSGLSEKSIRYYESMGLLVVGRCDNGYRVYEENQIKRLQVINLFRSLHVSIDSIKSYVDGEVSLDELLGQHMGALQEEINDLKEIKTFCLKMQKDCEHEEDLLTQFEKRNQTKGLRSEYQEIESQYLVKTKKHKRWLLLIVVWILAGSFLWDTGLFDGSVTMTIIFLEAVGILSLLIYYHVLPIHQLVLKGIGWLFMLDEIPNMLVRKLDCFFPGHDFLKRFIVLLMIVVLIVLVIGMVMLISKMF